MDRQRPPVHSRCTRHHQNDSLVFRFGKGNLSETLRGFAVYKAEGNFNIDSALCIPFYPKQFRSGNWI